MRSQVRSLLLRHMKKFIFFLLFGSLVSLGIWRYNDLTRMEQTVHVQPIPVVAKVPATNTPSAEFIQLCSGLEPTSEQTRLLAQANCLGRIRGYTDSHQQTVRMLQQQYAISRSSQLWCVPRSVNDKELLTVILRWADANPSEYDSVTSKYSGTAGAMGVLAAALRAEYPCSK